MAANVGEVAPDFKLTKIDGSPVSVSDLAWSSGSAYLLDGLVPGVQRGGASFQ